MKKILISSNSTWNILNYRKQLLEELRNKEFKIVICSPFDKFVAKIIKNDFEYIPIKIDRKSYNFFINLKIFFSYIFILYSEKPDCLMTFTIKPNIFGSLASLFSKKKIFIFNFVTGLGTFYFDKSIFKKIIIFLYKIAFTQSTNVFFQNSYDMEYFIKNNILKKEKGIIISGSGVDINFFKFNKIIFKKKDDLIFLCISRLIKDKGIIEYIESAKLIKKEYPKIKFILLGSQDNKNISNIEDKYWIDNIKNYIDHIEFNDDVLKYIIMSDCVVMPSYREGTSRALLEAASVGRPLIGTDVPGCNNIVIDEYNGYLCKKGDIESLFNTIKKMINTPFEKREKMSLKSRRLIEKQFDVKIVNKRIVNEISKLNNEKL